MSRKLIFLLTTAAIAAAAAPAFALPSATIRGVSLEAAPPHYVGKCPGVVTFHGEVRVTGQFDGGKPVEIGYQFTRSDGGTGQNQFFNATHDGAYPLTETWTLGGPQVPHFGGWEKVKTWVTDSGEGGNKPPVWSNEAHFTLTCKDR